MENKINIAELLKDCPKGMELDYALFEDTIFIGVEENKNYPIIIKLKDGSQKRLTKYGCHSNADNAKCVIFPKGKTTWEGFQSPFKEGDIVISYLGGIHILKNHTTSYCYLDSMGILYKTLTGNIVVIRLATEVEKQKLFNAIKANGYKWNSETKTLEKLVKPIFKKGDKVRVKNGVDSRTIDDVCDTFYTLVPIGKIPFIDQDNWELVPNIKPNFKVGDRIRRKNDKTIIKTIGYIYHDSYALYDGRLLFFKEQDQYELVPDKFEISRLKPFDKVLVRNSDNGKWCGQFYMAYNKNEDYPFECTYNCWRQCIPYEGNEHLRNTTNACRPFYKTWE